MDHNHITTATADDWALIMFSHWYSWVYNINAQVLYYLSIWFVGILYKNVLSSAGL